MEGGPDPDDHDASPYGGAGGEPPAPQRATTPDWPLTGRESEFRSLCDMVLSGDRRTVVVAGPTGVGKTRLGHECLAAAARADRDTVRMIATRSAAPLPFGAVAPLLHLVTSGEGGGPGEDGVDVLRRSVAALASRLDGRDLVLFVDDAHLLDDASAALVHQVATTGAATVLATVRTGEPAPDAVVALWKDGPAERLELGGLTRSSIESLLTAVLGGPVDPAALIELTERSQGNILFLRELVNGALDDGSLVGDDGIWRLRRELSPSARLVEIVEASFGELDDDERALLELVAHGEPLGHAELASLSDPAVAEALERRGLLTSRVDGRRLQIRLAHPIYGDVLRSRTPALRARAVARSLAEVAERTRLRRHEDILRVANWHLLDGGGHPDRLLDAANIARGRHDLALAERLARAAVERGAGPDAALLAAHLAGQQGRRSEAEQQLAVLASDAGPDAQRGRAAVARFDNALARTGGDAVDALAGMSHGATDTSWREVFESRRLALVLDSEGPRAAARAATELAAQADGEALAVSCVIGAHSLVRLGDLDRAFALADRGEAAHATVDDPLAWHPWWHVATRCRALLHAGRFRDADRIIADHHARALDEGCAEARSIFAVLEAEAANARGRVRTAARRTREALSVDHEQGRLLHARRGHVVRALALALAGQADAAANELRTLEDLGLPAGRDEVDLQRARAWTAVAAGDIPGARHHLTEAAGRARAIGDVIGEATALHDVARLGRAREVCDRLLALAARIDGDLAPACAAHAVALARNDGAALEEAARDFGAMGADLLAAEAAADAAVARRRKGQLRDAAAAERHAAMLVTRCENPVTPALLAVEARARLTPAERETAVLAAAGRSNREIAEHLVLSPRTVENRLQRVYEKLGVAGRTALAEALDLGD